MPILLIPRSSVAATWAFRQEASDDTGTTTPTGYAVTLGTPTNGGSVIIIVVSDATISTPSGFTLDASQVFNNGHYVFRKATSTGETTWNLTPSVGASGCWYVAEITGLVSGLDRAVGTGSGVGSSAPRSTGTTATTTAADEVAIGSWASSVAVNPARTYSAQTNGFVERITDRATTKPAGTNIGLSVASLTLSAPGAIESSATPSGSSAGTAIMVTYPVSTGGPGPVSGSVTGTATASGTVVAQRNDTGALTGTATTSGTVTGQRSDTGAVTGTATASAASVGNASAAGGGTALATAAGTVTGQRTDTGTVTGTTTAQGTAVPASLLGDVRIRRAVAGRF